MGMFTEMMEEYKIARESMIINNPEYFLADFLSHKIYNILENSKKDTPVAFLGRLSKEVKNRDHANVLREIENVFLKNRRKIPKDLKPLFSAEHLNTKNPGEIQFILDVGDCILEIVDEMIEEALFEDEA